MKRRLTQTVFSTVLCVTSLQTALAQDGWTVDKPDGGAEFETTVESIEASGEGSSYPSSAWYPLFVLEKQGAGSNGWSKKYEAETVITPENPPATFPWKAIFKPPFEEGHYRACIYWLRKGNDGVYRKDEAKTDIGGVFEIILGMEDPGDDDDPTDPPPPGP